MARPHRSRFPVVSQYVRLHARRRPGHVAVQLDDRAITYAILDRDLAVITPALAAFGLAPGRLVAIGLMDLYLQLLMVFGFEALGIATASFLPSEGTDCHDLLAAADLTITAAPLPGAPAKRQFLADAAWAAATLAGPVPPAARPRPAAAEDVALVTRSSGTTGRPKRMELTHRMLHARFQDRRAGDGAGARYLVAMHFAVFTVYSRIAYLLRVGGTLIFAPEAECDLRRFLLRTRPTATTVLPHHLHGLLAALPPPDGTRRPLLPALNLAAIGAKLPDHLRSWALDRLCGTISEGYGANEIGAICRFDRTGSGAVHRSVTLEVLDADGQPAAFGEAGEIRLRSTGMVRGYVNDPAASAAMFRDGWFYPGDLGILTEAGTLRLVGRRQDVLNIGGAKRSCAELESQVLRHAPESDVAVLQRDGGVASSLVYVCVAGPAAADPDRLARAVEPAMECQFTMVALPAIPRTAQGKIRREALHDMLFGRPAPARAAPRREALLTTDN